MQKREIPTFILYGPRHFNLRPHHPVNRRRKIVHIAALQQASIGNQPPESEGRPVSCGKPVGGRSFSAGSASPDPTGEELAIVAVALSVVGIHEVGIISGLVSRDIRVDSFHSKVQIRDLRHMGKVDPGVQGRLLRVEQREGLGFAHRIRVNRHQISEVRKLVGGADGRAAVPRFEGLKIPVLGKSVEECLQRKRPPVSGEHCSERKSQFQILGGFERYIGTPDKGLRIDRMDPVAIER